MTTKKLSFSRDDCGRIDLSDEKRIDSAAHALHSKHGMAARVSMEFRGVCQDKLIRAVNEVRTQCNCSFDEAVRRAHVSHPGLLYFSMLGTLPVEEVDFDLEVTDGAAA